MNAWIPVFRSVDLSDVLAFSEMRIPSPERVLRNRDANKMLTEKSSAAVTAGLLQYTTYVLSCQSNIQRAILDRCLLDDAEWKRVYHLNHNALQPTVALVGHDCIQPASEKMWLPKLEETAVCP